MFFFFFKRITCSKKSAKIGWPWNQERGEPLTKKKTSRQINIREIKIASKAQK